MICFLKLEDDGVKQKSAVKQPVPLNQSAKKLDTPSWGTTTLLIVSAHKC